MCFRQLLWGLWRLAQLSCCCLNWRISRRGQRHLDSHVAHSQQRLAPVRSLADGSTLPVVCPCWAFAPSLSGKLNEEVSVQTPCLWKAHHLGWQGLPHLKAGRARPATLATFPDSSRRPAVCCSLSFSGPWESPGFLAALPQGLNKLRSLSFLGAANRSNGVKLSLICCISRTKNF